ncbi:MAG: hypothetical protein JO327_03660 [Nitrososphaeraceae archaeon]|nr:hypothetical protein [Nitrososphaeraceae archaeon]MBV9667207.1 hypothetical protein [Nitrososphaeraceae archaeon]
MKRSYSDTIPLEKQGTNYNVSYKKAIWGNALHQGLQEHRIGNCHSDVCLRYAQTNKSCNYRDGFYMAVMQYNKKYRYKLRRK